LKRYPVVLIAAAIGIVLGALVLTGGLFVNPQTSAVPAVDHFSDSEMPVDVKFSFTDREKGLEALGSNYLYVDENLVDDENHCEFCIFAEYNPGSLGKATYAFRSNSPVDLSNATTLTFLARGENGGEIITVYAVGRKVTQTSPSNDAIEDDHGLRSVVFSYEKELTLTKGWIEYEVSLADLDLDEVTHPFAFSMRKGTDGETQIAYLDLIYFDNKTSEYALRLN
jgi:hypothetical protein